MQCWRIKLSAIKYIFCFLITLIIINILYKNAKNILRLTNYTTASSIMELFRPYHAKKSSIDNEHVELCNNLHARLSKSAFINSLTGINTNATAKTILEIIIPNLKLVNSQKDDSLHVKDRSTNLSVFEKGRNMMSADKEGMLQYACKLGNIFPAHLEPNYRIEQQNTFAHSYAKTMPSSAKNKTILRIGKFNFNILQWKEGNLQKCPIKNCVFTSDMRFNRSADALLISQLDSDALRSLLPKPANQIWISQHLECPNYNRINPLILNNLINWTASYRPDSTIAIPYNYMTRLDKSQLSYKPHKNDISTHNRLSSTYFDTTFTESVPHSIHKSSTAANLHSSAHPSHKPGRKTFNFAKGKRKKVAWVVTNCRAFNLRWQYMRRLSEFIEVDVYGACGQMKCKNKDCFTELKEDYKFYLAFENSNCAHYITEKFLYNALSYNMVAVVMGAKRKEYEMLAPPSSFIHVDDFTDAQHLAAHLHKLDANDSLYNEYFRWREEYAITSVLDSGYFCRLCLLLNLREELGYVHWYRNFARWWDICWMG